MKILFDHQTFSLQQYGGISRYFSALQEYVHHQQDFTMNRGLLFSKNHYLPRSASPLPAKCGKVFLSRSRAYSLNKKYSQYLLRKNKFDVFHPTYYDAYFLPLLKKPFVITVHDMTHELFPEFFPVNDPFISYKRKTIERADHIIAVSASTSYDLQEIFNIDEKKISVIHHGYYNENVEPDAAFQPIPSPFVLFVGHRGGYKNFTRFITAMTPLLHIDKELFVICAGGGAFNLSERELLLRNKVSGKVVQLSVGDAQLKSLYQKALMFIYPSLYEGFGLPILEAFSSGCPVAASRTSCFPEVGGEAVAYFDPYDPYDILRAIEAVLRDSAYGLSLSQKGKIKLQDFPLKNCMEKTLDVYRKLGKK